MGAERFDLPLIGGGYIDTPFQAGGKKYPTTFGDVIASGAGTGQTEIAITGPDAGLPATRFMVDISPGFASADTKPTWALSSLGTGTYGRSFIVESNSDGTLTDLPFSFKIYLRPES